MDWQFGLVKEYSEPANPYLCAADYNAAWYMEQFTLSIVRLTDTMDRWRVMEWRTEMTKLRIGTLGQCHVDFL